MSFLERKLGPELGRRRFSLPMVGVGSLDSHNPSLFMVGHRPWSSQAPYQYLKASSLASVTLTSAWIVSQHRVPEKYLQSLSTGKCLVRFLPPEPQET